MPAKSRAQQRFFGMIHAYKQGKIRNASKNLREAAKRISDEDAKDFAKTKHDGLPEKAASLTRYEQGFLSKCAEYGLDAETSVALLEKRAALLPALAGFGRSAARALRSPAAANIGKKVWRGVQGAAGIGSSLYSLSWLAGNVMHGGAGMRENAGLAMPKAAPKAAPRMAPKMPPRALPKAASDLMHKNAYSMKKELKDIDEYTDRHPILTPVVGGGVGAKMMLDPRNISKLTGTEHLSHLTQISNVPGILEKGLLTIKSRDPSTISARFGMSDITKDMIFLRRKPGLLLDPIRTMQKVHKSVNLPTKVLKVRIPYDELIKMKPGTDPVYYRDLKHIEELGKRVKGVKGKLLAGVLKRVDPFGPGGTMAVKKNISPNFIKGSPKYTQTVLRELAGMPKYMLKHPKRFAKGLGTVGGGAAALGLAGYSLKKSVGRTVDRIKGKGKKKS